MRWRRIVTISLTLTMVLSGCSVVQRSDTVSEATSLVDKDSLAVTVWDS